MACNLKVDPSGSVDFLGSSGTTVTLTLTGPAGVDAEIVHLRYAGTGVSASPFQFTQKSGTNLLVVVVEASKAGALIQLREDCGDGTDNVLSTFHYDPQNPAPGFFIKSA